MIYLFHLISMQFTFMGLYFLSTSSYYYKSNYSVFDALFNDILNFISSESKTKKNLPDIFQARIIIGA